MLRENGKFSPCLYHSSAVDKSVFRHGDDFVVSGTRTQQEEIEGQLCELGQSPHGSGRERCEYEADPRHAELIVHQLGLSCSSRSVSTPSEKSKLGVDLGSVLNSTDHAFNQSATMRLCYLALDRPDLLFPPKELARWMQAPTAGNVEALKRVVGYLIGHGRLVEEFVRQVQEPSHVVLVTESDHAGSLETRKSTSSSKLFYGSHMLLSTSTAQGVVAQSSGESEFYALVKGTSAGLGTVSMLKDLGVDISKNTESDGTE